MTWLPVYFCVPSEGRTVEEHLDGHSTCPDVDVDEWTDAQHELEWNAHNQTVVQSWINSATRNLTMASYGTYYENNPGLLRFDEQALVIWEHWLATGEVPNAVAPLIERLDAYATD